MTSKEWAQMYFFANMLAGLELEQGTVAAYAMAVAHFVDFLSRYPLEASFSAAHRRTKAFSTRQFGRQMRLKRC